jgi:hypothetical protein
MAGVDNLQPVSSKEEARARGRAGGIKSGQVRKEKKIMSQIYAEFLEKEHDIVGNDGLKIKISGQALVNRVMSKVMARGDSSSVRLLKEIRESTEGTKLNIDDLQLNIKVEYID